MNEKTTMLDIDYLHGPEQYLRLATLCRTQRIGRYRIDLYDFCNQLINGEIYVFAACAFEENSGTPALSIMSIRCMLTLRTRAPISPTPTLLIFQHGIGKVADPGLESDDWNNIGMFETKALELIGKKPITIESGSDESSH